MKASDFTTGGNDREKAMSNLLKTEKTDAVNTGLVEKADKSAKALKGDLYSVGKKGTHGARRPRPLPHARNRRPTRSGKSPPSRRSWRNGAVTGRRLRDISTRTCTRNAPENA